MEQNEFMSEQSPVDPQDRVVWALRRAGFAIDGLKECRLREVGVTGSQYAMLMMLRSEQGLSGAELARRLHVSPQAVAGLVQRLDDLGLLQRRAHHRHRHVQELHLTDAGQRALDSAETIVSELERGLEITLGPAAYDRLRTLLESVAAYGDEQER